MLVATQKCILLHKDETQIGHFSELIKSIENLELSSVHTDIASALAAVNEQKPLIFIADNALINEQSKVWFFNQPYDVQIIIINSGSINWLQEIANDKILVINNINDNTEINTALHHAMDMDLLARLRFKKNANSLIFKHNSAFVEVDVNEITFIESRLNYVMIHTNAKRYMTYSSLKNFEYILPSDIFIKVQKSFIVNRNHAQVLQNKEIMVKDQCISISRHNKEIVLRKFS
jgi:two-component system, LytTR family, response regulator